MTDFRAKGTIMGLAGLTAVFGMGTGVSSWVKSPASCLECRSFGSSLANRRNIDNNLGAQKIDTSEKGNNAAKRSAVSTG